MSQVFRSRRSYHFYQEQYENGDSDHGRVICEWDFEGFRSQVDLFSYLPGPRFIHSNLNCDPFLEGGDMSPLVV